MPQNITTWRLWVNTTCSCKYQNIMRHQFYPPPPPMGSYLGAHVLHPGQCQLSQVSVLNSWAHQWHGDVPDEDGTENKDQHKNSFKIGYYRCNHIEMNFWFTLLLLLRVISFQCENKAGRFILCFKVLVKIDTRGHLCSPWLYRFSKAIHSHQENTNESVLRVLPFFVLGSSIGTNGQKSNHVAVISMYQ